MKNNNLKKLGFTIIEILVVIFLFSALVLVSSSSLVTGFLSGALHSSSEKSLNRDLSYTMNIIRQKMANANEENVIALADGTVYGFKYKLVGADKILVIVNSLSGGGNTCQLIAWKSADTNLYIKEETCVNTTSLTIPTGTSTGVNGWKKANSDGITITDFTITPTEYTSSSPNIPSFTISIMGKDNETNAEATLTDTFTVPYATVQRWL